MTVLPQITPASPDTNDALKRLALLASLTAVLIFLPFILFDGGRFTLIADFNHQQIPFNQHSAWVLKNNAVGWDWYTDLGVNFIGAFSFYTLGSPFFWIGRLFPVSAFPFLIGWLFILKYIAASLFAFLWLKDHVKDPDYAVAGALLYAFSGFSNINLMYYHFHEVIAMFPLLLYALDRLIQKKQRGLFALTVALCALINYFFFFGQVLFLMIYFFFFYRFPTAKERFTKFFTVMGEGLLGVFASAILLLPSALFIINSPKAGNVIYYQDLILHSIQRYLAIIKALVFPAESMIIQSSVLPYDFSSSSFYLPVLGFSMVLAAGILHQLNRRFILLILIFLLIPGLNSAFTLFNSDYYARWFYMPLLIFTALSMQSLEDAPRKIRLRGVKQAMVLTAVFILVNLGFALKEADWIKNSEVFTVSSLIASLGLVATLLIFRKGDHRRLELLTRLIVVFAVITGLFSISLIRSFNPPETYRYAQGYFDKTAQFDLTPPEGENAQNYRFYAYDAGWNLSMLNHIPSVNSFITTNSPSVHEFFKTVGIRHIAASQYPTENHDILTFLSVRYRVDKTRLDRYAPLYEKNNGALDLYVSENPDFIPLGFPLDYWISQEDLMLVVESDRAKILMQALVLKENQPVPDGLLPYPMSNQTVSVAEIAQTKKNQAVQNFQRDHKGFTGNLSSTTARTILFTVPWDGGWQARIDGQPVKILKDLGFMAIQVPKGNSTIEFSYAIPGLKTGIWLSILGAAGIIILLVYSRRNQTEPITIRSDHKRS